MHFLHFPGLSCTPTLSVMAVPRVDGRVVPSSRTTNDPPPCGTLLLTIDQIDSTADGMVVLFSREHHVADAFTFSVLRRGPGVSEEETI